MELLLNIYHTTKDNLLYCVDKQPLFLMLLLLILFLYSEVWKNEQQKLSYKKNREWLCLVTTLLGLWLILSLIYPVFPNFWSRLHILAYQMRAIFCMIPSLGLVCYCLAIELREKKGLAKLGTICLIFSMVIMSITVTNTVTSKNFTSFSLGKIDAEVVELSNLMESGKVIAPVRVASQLTEFESNNAVCYGLNVRYDETNNESMMMCAAAEGCDYIVMEPEYVNEGYMNYNGYEYKGATEHYVVYHYNPLVDKREKVTTKKTSESKKAKTSTTDTTKSSDTKQVSTTKKSSKEK